MKRQDLTYGKKSHRSLSIAIAVAVAASITLAACGGSSNSSAPKKGGTLTFAEGPGAAPNYIFPYLGCANFSVANINQFQDLMYRPLYWFGLGASSAVQYNLSTAKKPVFSAGDTVITINMKGWQFSDGTQVNAQSAQFFLNLYKADPTSYCGYNPGFGIPDQLSAVTSQGNVLTLTFKSSVNPNWILYNYLSEITPMPQAWDKTSINGAPGSGGCSTGAWGAAATDTACKAVEKFLDAQSTNSTTYTDSTWQTVDGPWKLTAFDSLGNATLVPNTTYSGPQKALVSQVQLKAYLTTTAEQSDLEAGNLSLGFVDPTTLPGPAASLTKVGPNIGVLKGKYILETGSPWSFNYAPFNFSKTNAKAALLKPLYIREALQEAINQPQIIKSVDKGYGVVTCSPLPPNTPTSIAGSVACPYPYSQSGAEALLTAHGWKLEGKVQTCEQPGTGATDCGAGIAKGEKLSLSIIWASGIQSLDTTFAAEIAEWAAIGIQFSHSTATFDTVVAGCGTGGTFQICSWGAGWIYAPDYYPSGETLFTPTGGFNPGGYSDAQMTTLIKATTFGTAPLTAYASYAAAQLPVLYQPNPTATLEVSTKLVGVPAPDPLQNFMPEYISFK
jgi:peptide/nickel transport system substrate-binding protein